MINRLSHSRLGNISFIARETISYFVTSERSESYDNLYIYGIIFSILQSMHICRGHLQININAPANLSP